MGLLGTIAVDRFLPGLRAHRLCTASPPRCSPVWSCSSATDGRCGDDVRVHFEDLSEYDYQDEDAFTDAESGFYALWYRPAYRRLAVGWLEAGRPYPKGAVPAAFAEKLQTVQKVQWMNVCLGLHACDLCPPGEAPEGNGEIRIPGEPGVAYAAPFLITHYVTAHGYRPPQVFVDAVLAVDLDAWAAARWPDVPFPWVPEDAELMLG